MPELIPAEPGSPDWLAARRLGVTATDIVTIIGLSHWDSPYSLFWRKLGQVPEVEDNDRFRLGRELEPYIGNRWAESARSDGKTFLLLDGALYRHSERAWQMATCDRLVNMSRDGRLLREHAEHPPAVLELKTWADADRRAWDTAPPPQVRAQVLWQMDVMGVAAGHVGVVFLPSGEFRSYTIEHTGPHAESGEAKFSNDTCSLCADLRLMRDAGEEFMARLRLELPPPDPDSSLATLAAVRARFARVPAKQAEIDPSLWQGYRMLKDDIAHFEDTARGIEIKIREQAGEAAELCVDGQVVARRIISHATVKEHVRHQDYLRRVKQQGDDDDDHA